MKNSSVINEYRKNSRKKLLVIAGICILYVATIIIALLSGSADYQLNDVFQLITGNSDAFTEQILFQIRIPRILGAMLAGTALAVSGAAIQSLLRNPLASPFTLGISGAAAFGAALCIVFFNSTALPAGISESAIHPYLISLSAFICSLAGVVLILALSRLRGATPEIIILAGIIISSLFGAGISAMQYFADTVQLSSIVFWTFGDLSRAHYDNLLILSFIVIPATIYFILQSWNYKALQTGDEYAQSIGVRVKKVRMRGMIIASLVTAIVVSFYGIIAFVGLVVPHIIRRITGDNEQYLIPVSALFGGLFLLASDTLARSIFSPVVMPVGILTSFLGAPLFLFVLIKGMKKPVNYS